MNYRKLAAGMALIVVASAGLAGCNGEASLGAETDGKGGVKLNGQIKATWTNRVAAMMAGVSSINAGDIYLDTTGTDFALDTSGVASVALTNSSGAVVASNAINWVKSGTRLVPQNPSALQAWLSNYPNAIGYAISSKVGQTPADGLVHKIAGAAVYQGTVQASVVSGLPAICTNPRVHTIYRCMDNL